MVSLGPGAVGRLLQVALWHFGALHAYEKVLALLLAFGPFVVLGAVIAVRRRDDSEQRSEDRGPRVGSGSD